jgi:hypothetical protein
VVVASFSDPDGGLTTRPPVSNRPRDLLATSSVREHGGKTTITVEWVPMNSTDAEREIFNAKCDSCQQGWTGTLD